MTNGTWLIAAAPARRIRDVRAQTMRIDPYRLQTNRESLAPDADKDALTIWKR